MSVAENGLVEDAPIKMMPPWFDVAENAFTAVFEPVVTTTGSAFKFAIVNRTFCGGDEFVILVCAGIVSRPVGEAGPAAIVPPQS